MKLKLFASDLDGTLLNEYGKISKKSVDAIRRVQRSGGIFLAATGRTWSSVHAIFQEADLACGAILLNGAEYRNADGEILSCKTIGDKITSRIAAVLMRHVQPFEVHTGKGDFKFSFKNRERERAFFYGPEVKATEVRKFFIRSHDPLLLEQLRQELGIIEGINLTSSAEDNLEIVSDKTDKGRMLEEVVARYGIDKAEVAVFGDGENDLPMMRHFPHSYAVANADDRVKQQAKTIIRSNREDGVARQILKLL